MVWASNNFLSARIRFGCPVMELWHPYKKLLEDTWKKPELFYTFFAPLEHSLHPASAVYVKPKMKKLEAYFTALRMIWQDYRQPFLQLLPAADGNLKVHLQNILLLFEFFLPVVPFSRISFFYYSSCVHVTICHMIRSLIPVLLVT